MVLIGVCGFSVELNDKVSVLHVSRVVLDQFINVCQACYFRSWTFMR